MHTHVIWAIGKSIIIWRAQSSITSRNGKFRIPAEGGRCLPARGGSIQHLEILELKV